MLDALLGLLVVVAILGGSAWLTSVFARTMYRSCPSCGTLNAKRREVCRTCRQPLGPGMGRGGANSTPVS